MGFAKQKREEGDIQWDLNPLRFHVWWIVESIWSEIIIYHMFNLLHSSLVEEEYVYVYYLIRL